MFSKFVGGRKLYKIGAKTPFESSHLNEVQGSIWDASDLSKVGGDKEVLGGKLHGSKEGQK